MYGNSLRRVRRKASAARGPYAPTTFCIASFICRSSAAVRSTYGWSFARVAAVGKISSLVASFGSIFCIACCAPTTGVT